MAGMRKTTKKNIAGLAALLLAVNGALPLPAMAEETVPSELQTEEYHIQDYPDLTSRRILLEDVGSGQVLLDQGADEQMYPASLTKMMTEIIAIENLPDLNRTITMTDVMWAGLLEADASVAGFWPGQTPTVWDLLCGCALPSGADAVNALAITVSGSVDAFVDLMNEKAQEIGMSHTRFSNPTGLHDDNHYTTARDMLVLLNYCLQNETFVKLISLHSYTATTGLEMISSLWGALENVTVPGMIGGKTGFTEEAGRCLASAAELNGMKLIMVTGGSEGIGHIADAYDMYSWLNDSIARTDVIHAGDTLANVQVLDASETQLVFTASEDIAMDLPKDAVITIDSSVDAVTAPVEENAVIGTVEIKAGDTVIASGSLSVPHRIRRSIFRYLGRRMQEHKGVTALVLILIAVLVFMEHQRRETIRRRKRRRKKKKKTNGKP